MWFKVEDEKQMKKKYGQLFQTKNRFSHYDGVDDLPARRDHKLVDGKLCSPDFYISWSPGINTDIPNNNGPCKRYWAGRPNHKKKRKEDAEQVYCDERIDKCAD